MPDMHTSMHPHNGHFIPIQICHCQITPSWAGRLMRMVSSGVPFHEQPPNMYGTSMGAAHPHLTGRNIFTSILSTSAIHICHSHLRHHICVTKGRAHHHQCKACNAMHAVRCMQCGVFIAVSPRQRQCGSARYPAYHRRRQS